MTNRPDVAHTHIWDGGTVPAWMGLDAYHFDNNELIVHTADGDTRPQPGWWLICWTDQLITVASPAAADRVYGEDGIAGRLATLEHTGRTTPDNPAASGDAHVYLSTGCLHGEHSYCSNVDGIAGLKKPAQCKFCTAPCVCDCHTAPGPAAGETTDTGA